MLLPPALSCSFLLPFLLPFLITSLAFTIPPTNLLTLSTTNLTLVSNPHLTANAAQCLSIAELSMHGLNPTNCETAAQVLCVRLNSRPPEILLYDTWVWNELPGCAMGYYLPEHVPVPTLMQCNAAVDEIVELCASNSRFNAGAINVRTVPNFFSNGQAIRDGETRYMMAPLRLTRP